MPLAEGFKFGIEPLSHALIKTLACGLSGCSTSPSNICSCWYPDFCRNQPSAFVYLYHDCGGHISPLE